MPPYIYKGFTQGNRTLVNFDEKSKYGGTVGVPTGHAIVPLETSELPEVAKKLKLSGALTKQLENCKAADHKAKKEKLKDLKPIVFDIHQKPKF